MRRLGIREGLAIGTTFAVAGAGTYFATRGKPESNAHRFERQSAHIEAVATDIGEKILKLSTPANTTPDNYESDPRGVPARGWDIVISGSYPSFKDGRIVHWNTGHLAVYMLRRHMKLDPSSVYQIEASKTTCEKKPTDILQGCDDETTRPSPRETLIGPEYWDVIERVPMKSGELSTGTILRDDKRIDKALDLVEEIAQGVQE